MATASRENPVTPGRSPPADLDAGSTSAYGLGWDYLVLLLGTVVLVAAGSRLHPRPAT